MRRLALLLLLTATPALALSPHAGYLLHCSGCHGADGAGSVNGGIPAFQDSVALLAGDAEGRLYMMHVPGVVSAGLSDQDTADVTNYILDLWGPDAPRFTASEVKAARATPVPDVVALRRQIAHRMDEGGTPLSRYPWP